MSAYDQLASLMIQEQDSGYRLHGAPSYLLVSVGSRERNCDRGGFCGINEVWRLKIAEWAFEVVDYFSLNREAVAVALNYVDRFMVTYNRDKIQTSFTREKYQLLTITSLYLAIKLHGSAPDDTTIFARPTIQVFVELSRKRFTGAEIEAMERSILQKLEWKLNPPLAINFVAHLMILLPSWQTEEAGPDAYRCMRASLYELARYMAEISICVSDFSLVLSPSVVAFAAILTSISALERDPSVAHVFPPDQVLTQFIDNVFAATALTPIMKDIKKARSLIVEVCPSALGQHLRRRCPSTRAFHKVALIGDELESCSSIFGWVNSAREHASPSPTEILLAFEQTDKPTE